MHVNFCVKRSESPLITIIVGVYNGEKYLRECLESVIAQDYENIEIIVVNDGSTDKSSDIIDEYVAIDSRMKAVHKQNEGVSVARNVALNMSNGEYICFLDQDDVLSVDYVSYLFGLIKKHDVEISLTWTADKFYDKIHEDSDYVKANEQLRVLSGHQTAIEMLYHKIIIAPWNKMIKRNLIVRNNILFDPRFYNGEGFAFSVQCFQHAEKTVIGERKVYHYRVGDQETGASKFKESTIHSCVDSQIYIKETIVVPDDAIMKAWRFSNWHSHCDALNIMVGCGAVSKYQSLYDGLAKVCRSDALCALFAPVSFQQRLRGVLYKISPYMAAKIINHFRIRKFSKI